MNQEKFFHNEMTSYSNHDAITRLLRKMIFEKLRTLKYGNLTIIDKESPMIFGHSEDPLKATLIVLDPLFYIDLFTKGSIGAAEAFINERWKTNDLDSLMAIFAANKDVLSDLDSGLVNLIKPVRFLEYWKQRNTIAGSKKNILAHYDLPDELFRLFLDKTMMYSSAIYPSETANLYEAQNNKLRIIAESLNIKPGMHILEIGSGWGALAVYLAKNYSCHVTTTTISENQYAEVRRRIQENNLEEKITLLKLDYRLLEGKFDRIVSIEMIEAVGEKFLGTYLNKISTSLKEDGLALLQAITITDQVYDRAVKEVDFIKKFIFPGSFIPSIHAIASEAKKNSDMRIICQKDFADHYAKTLKDWKNNFHANSDKLASIGLDDSFARMWNFYFSYCIGGFSERAIGVSHITFAKPQYKNTFKY